jgi:hypothetical protein
MNNRPGELWTTKTLQEQRNDDEIMWRLSLSDENKEVTIKQYGGSHARVERNPHLFTNKKLRRNDEVIPQTMRQFGIEEMVDKPN